MHQLGRVKTQLGNNLFHSKILNKYAILHTEVTQPQSLKIIVLGNAKDDNKK